MIRYKIQVLSSSFPSDTRFCFFFKTILVDVTAFEPVKDSGWD
jgi:hypothetical protein